MSTERDYFLEDLLKDSESMLEELKEFGGMEEILDSGDEGSFSGDDSSTQDPLGIPEPGAEVPRDGLARIRVDDDGKCVYGSLYPPTGGGAPLTNDDVETLLQQKGIVYGILWEDLQGAVFACNTDLSPQEDVLIARAKEPEKEIPEHYELEPALVENPRQANENKGRVDFRMTSPFIMVHKGDVLARLVTLQPGVIGYTVYGQEIPFAKREIQRLKPGKNTLTEGDTVVAACDGRFEHTDDEFWVNEVLALEGDVGYKTGHIDFPGDVMIKGQIKDDFHIHAGGDVYCEKTMDASEVVCGKDLYIKLGIIGRKKGRVKVGGKLRAKFIENCHVEAKGSIYLDAGIINSTVYSSNRIELQKRGVIVGGTVYAQNGVLATQIGTETGPRTEIYCGIDYVVENKLGWIRDKNIELVMTLKKVEERLKRNPADKDLQTMHRKVKLAIEKFNAMAGDLVFKLDKNDNAEILVKGTVFPGVYIEICHVAYVVDRKMSAVRFRLDKERGKVVPDTLN